MKSFINSQDALLYLMTNRFTHHLDDKHGNSYYLGNNNNTIDIEIWKDRGDGILDMIDVEIISYEDFIKIYDGVELFVTENI